jgi:hypothetical protein
MQWLRGAGDEKDLVGKFPGLRQQGFGKISRPRRYCLLWFQSQRRGLHSRILLRQGRQSLSFPDSP